jgi:hypothetical protein
LIWYHAAPAASQTEGSLKALITIAPVQELTPQATDTLLEQLRAYYAIYSPLFQRREQREGAETYLRGLRLDLPRKSIEPMVLALEGPTGKAVQTMQLLLVNGAGTTHSCNVTGRRWKRIWGRRASWPWRAATF